MKPIACGLLVLAAASCTIDGADPDARGGGKADEFSDAYRNCVHTGPLRGDGYTEFADVDPSKVTRKLLGGDGLVADPVTTVTPTEAEIRQTLTNIGEHVRSINEAFPAGSDGRRRETYRAFGGVPEPYCLFHAPGRPIYGTVLLFHGFNDRPQQQAQLATYLFHAGFNIYNVFLANHWSVPGTKLWPKTRYNPTTRALLATKLASPENQAILVPLRSRLEAGTLTAADVDAIDRVLAPELSVAMVREAWTNPGGASYAALYNLGDDVDFLAHVRHAEARLADLAPLPGPVFATGLSVGGAVAMALAASDGGARLRGVVAQAPWLRPVNRGSEPQLMIAAPLDEQVGLVGGAYPIQFQNHQIPFSPASAAANLALGSWLAGRTNVQRWGRVPHAFVTTEIDNSADNAAVAGLLDALRATPLGPLHTRVEYPRALNVGHALTDPENYANDALTPDDGGGWNRHWRTLYQEHGRFFLTGAMDLSNLLAPAGSQDRALPRVGCSIPQPMSARCD